MADLTSAAATEALNEEDYINKLYDELHSSQKKLIADAYAENTGALDTAQQDVQQQTGTNLQRTNVEAQKVQQDYKPANTSDAVSQQAALSMGNQQKKNVSTLQNAQAEADAEIERKRLLLGEQYSAAIKQAQADNDMLRAEQLYAEAKEKDAQIRSLKTEAGKLLAETGDNTLLMSLLEGGTLDTASTGETWDEVLKYEDSVNAIYDNANESARLQAESVTAAILSQLKAEREQEQKETDRKLTETYVNALRQGKNYDEVQGAYGLGSGNKAQAKLARMLGTTEDMTNLRGVQTGTDAAIAKKVAAAIQDRNDTVTDAVTENERSRVQALYDAAKDEEQALIDTQETVGKTLAEQGDYSILGKLYGLTQEQIDKLQGTDSSSTSESTSESASGSSSGSSGGSETAFERDEGAGETETGTTEQTEPMARGQESILELGYGPISQENLTQKIEKGEVTEIPTSTGSIYLNTSPTNPALTQSAIVEAAAEAAKKNDTAAIEAFKNLPVVFANPSEGESDGSETDKSILSLIAEAFSAAVGMSDADKAAVPKITSSKKTTTTKSSSAKFKMGGGATAKNTTNLLM